MKKTVGLKEIYLILRKRLWLIAAITLIAGVMGVVITHYFMTPMYEATTRILVNQSNAQSLYGSNAVQTNVQLVTTYSELINDPSILNKVIQKLQLNLTASDLQGMLTVQTSQDSQIFSITTETGQPELSVRIVNGIAQVFKAQVRSMMKIDNVTLLSPATLSTSDEPVSPNLHKNVTIAMIIGLLFAVGLAFLIEYLDHTIKTEEDIEQRLGLPVVGVISHLPSNSHVVKRSMNSGTKMTKRQTASESGVKAL